jgi:hypothetical protein
LRPRQEKAQGGRHRAKISADIDDVGEQKQTNEPIEQSERVVLAHVARQAHSGHAADLRADHLNGAHQRVGQEQRPNQAQSKLGAGLRIGCDAAGIVIGGAGDEAGSQYIGQPRTIGPLDLFRGRTTERRQS